MTTERRNLWLAIAAVALGQAAVLGWMIWDRTSLLANGREVVLEVIPVDPRSLFRGDYVILGYDISRYKLPPGTTPPKRNDFFYVTLRKGEGDTFKPWNALPWRTGPLPSDPEPDLNPEIDDAERFLAMRVLRRYVTYCARRGRWKSMNAAAGLYRKLERAL